MNKVSLSCALRRFREDRQYSVDCLAEMAGIPLFVYQSIENGETIPGGLLLSALLDVLDVSVKDLTHPVPKISKLRFRSDKNLEERRKIISRTERWYSDYNDLEQRLGLGIRYKLKDVSQKIIASASGGKEAAKQVREAMGLDSKRELPLYNISGLLEAHGIKVGEIQVEGAEDFFGLSVGYGEEDESSPAILVNTWEELSAERWVFSAVSELAHLILHPKDYDVGVSERSEKHERKAAEFACYFLMPERAFKKKYEQACSLDIVDRVMKIKHIYSVSYKTVLHRIAQDYKEPQVWKVFHEKYFARYKKSLVSEESYHAIQQGKIPSGLPEAKNNKEPDGLLHIDFKPGRFSKTVIRAIDEAKISVQQGSDMLGIPEDEVLQILDHFEVYEYREFY